MIRIHNISIRLPEEFEESEEGFLMNSSNNIEELLKEKEPSISTIKS